LARDKSNGVAKDKRLRDRRGEILFIDARKLGHMVDRTRREFSDADIARIGETYHAWREGEGYEDVPGFAIAASHDVIAGHGYVLTPGRYVGTESTEEDAGPFPERFATLRIKLEEQFINAHNQSKLISEQLALVS